VSLADIDPAGNDAPIRFPAWAGRARSLASAAVLVAVLAFGAWALRGMAWRGLWNAIARAHPGWLALAAALNLCVIGLQALRWLALLRPISPRPRLTDTFQAMIVGLSVSAVVPARAGELVRMRWLHRRTGLSQATVLGSIGLDQWANVGGFVAGLGALTLMGGLPRVGRGGAVAAVALFSLGLAVLVALPRLGRGARGARPGGVPGRPPGWRARLRQGLLASESPPALARAFAASFAAWALEVVVLRFALRAVGVDLTLTASLVVLLAVNLVLALPLVPPGNFGTLETGATISLLGYGVGKERALAFALLYHALQIGPIAILGLVLAGRSARRGRPLPSRR